MPESASASSQPPAAGEQPETTASPASDTGTMSLILVPVAELTTHPGNVRSDLHLDDAFVSSITESGILVPLRITVNGQQMVLIDGHRRLAAAIKAGHAEVPCHIAADRADDLAGQYLDMVVTSHHREPLTALEEADALFAAQQAGAASTRIRKATGMSGQQVKKALTAASLSGESRATVSAAGALRLDELAVLAEFDAG